MLTYCILSPLAPPQLVGLWLSFSVLRTVYPLCQWSSTFLTPGTSFMEDSFSTDWGWARLFQDDVNTLNVLCTLLLLLLRLLHLRSSGFRSWGLRRVLNPPPQFMWPFFAGDDITYLQITSVYTVNFCSRKIYPLCSMP